MVHNQQRKSNQTPNLDRNTPNWDQVPNPTNIIQIISVSLARHKIICVSLYDKSDTQFPLDKFINSGII